MKIVEQIAYERARCDECPIACAYQPQTQGSNDSTARRKTVFHVQNIERMAHPDHPQCGQWGVYPDDIGEMDSRTEVGGNARNGEGQREFVQRRERLIVVQKADECHSHGTDDEAQRERLGQKIEATKKSGQQSCTAQC